jgi:hypothetical protein
MRATITFLFFFSIQIFAGIGIGSSAVGVLPVELSSFNCQINGRNIQLAWETKTEKNSDKFEVERLFTEENKWEKIGSVKATVLSNSPKQYSFNDNTLQPGNYKYRLKMIDNDGTFQFSKVLMAEIKQPKGFDIGQNFPNPFNPSTLITYSIPVSSKVIVKVYNISGKLISTLVNENKEAGSYTVNFDAAGLSTGIYFYKIQAGNFAKTMKMLLLK